MSNRDQDEAWKGWSFDREFLVDPEGNSYHQNDIKAVFYTRELSHEIMGNSRKIYSLKKELEDKIKALQLPDIIIRYQDGSEQTVKYNKRF